MLIDYVTASAEGHAVNKRDSEHGIKYFGQRYVLIQCWSASGTEGYHSVMGSPGPSLVLGRNRGVMWPWLEWREEGLKREGKLPGLYIYETREAIPGNDWLAQGRGRCRRGGSTQNRDDERI